MKLGQVERVLVDELQRAGFDNYGFYAVGPDGFAIVACTQRIHADGAGYSGETPCSEGGHVAQLDAGSWAAWFALPRPGMFRVIILAVTQRPIPVTSDDTAPLPSPDDGSPTLPDAFRTKSLTSAYTIQALVYVLRKSALTGETTIVPQSQTLSGTVHLQRAHLEIG
jgi:hypothetical protein